MTSFINNPTPSVFVKVSAVFTADGTLIVPAAWQIMSVTARETAGKTVPAGMNFGTTAGGVELFALASTMAANELRSSPLSIGAANRLGASLQISAFSASLDTTIYVQAATKAITAITRANPAVVTYSGADVFVNGQTIDLSAIVGMTELNGTQAVIANLNTGANTFELTGVDSTAFTAYSSGGLIGGWNGASVAVTIQMAQFD